LNRIFIGSHSLPPLWFAVSVLYQVVDSTAGNVMLCFLDCYSGYHQIALKVSDQDKTAFITPHDICCYKAMTFDLKNAGATYQKAIQKCLESQIGKNIEAYIDDVVIKTTAKDNLIADLAETFANLRHCHWKLNPKKCVFGVLSGKLLGFMVSHRGIEANPTKVDAIRKMKGPTGKKDVMKLTGMMVALGRFISKLGEKGLPFFKLLKKSDKFEWTEEADRALEELKTFLTTPPVMVPLALKETLLLYISASTQVVSAVLVAERPEEGHPILSNDLSTTSARSYLTAKLGTRNPRRCCTLYSSPRASCNITSSHTKSRSSPASPWEKSCIVTTPWGASSNGRSS
jgi:hypothetical protein